MTELNEMVNTVAGVDDWKCPFPHEAQKHDKVNVLPPPDTENDSKKLKKELRGAHPPNLPISFASGGAMRDEEVQFTAHHLIPGNESWPANKTKLYKWVDKRGELIKGDIGYDVNAAENGIALPGHDGASEWTDEQFQNDYAFACMSLVGMTRQFHDRHPAYSDFVVNTLNKIATKLENSLKEEACREKDCGGANGKPYDPPYGLLNRLCGVADRLRKRLSGSCDTWRKPVMTSRFALMYQNRGLTQAQAREELRKKNFDYSK